MPVAPSTIDRIQRRRWNDRRGLVFGILIGLGATGLTSSEAKAEIPPELAPGTKPNYIEFGPSFGHAFGGYGRHSNGWINYLYHFKGAAEGPALGAMAIVGGWTNSFRLTAGGLFEWDFKVVSDKPLGLYLGPHFAAGYGLRHRRDRATDHGLFMSAGPTLRLLVNDFWSFWVRPVNADFFVGTRFDFGITGAIGAGITF